ncbi:HTH-type transcriptional regulator MalT [Proteus mirabilis]|uniref:HTH-type transcriptional regulator MalT n=1 Tax=Proteus mirabilis TaxID=584 RepID=UPI0034E54773
MLIPSKLSRPVRHQNTVVRERLLTLLGSTTHYRLILVTSPAGYGKTTLLSHWATEKQHIGWYTLDDGDNQSERFAHYLIAAIQQATQGCCPNSESMAQKRQYANLNSLFSLLFIELTQWQHPIWLIIDDYHLINNPAIHDAMRFFLKHQPDNLTLVISSRNVPQLGVANLRVQEQLLEIDSQHLAFTHPEAKQFFDNLLEIPLETSECQRLCDDVAGWVTALQLIALSAKQDSHAAKHSARRLSGINSSHLNEYLVDEVLDNVNGEMRRLLLTSSLLRSMNDALIARISGTENGQMQLEDIERQGLFLQRMDSYGDWFNYHPLFSSFLRQRCQWELASELPQLHHAAAEGWMALGFPSEAIHHALAAENPLMLRDILLQHAWELFHQSELSLLESSLQAIPWEMLLDNPKLILLQAWLMQSQHRYGEVNTLLDSAEREMTKELDHALRGEFDALRAQVAINKGNPNEAEKLAHSALNLLPETNYYGHIIATSVLGEVHHCTGNLQRSLSMMQEIEAMAHRHSTWHYVLWSMLQQSEILFARGFLQSAYDIQEKASELIHEQHLEQLPMHEFLLRIRSQLMWAWGRLEESESAARLGMKVLSNYQPQQQLQCVVLVVLNALVRGDIDNARSHLHLIENLLSNGIYHDDWVSNADEARVIYWQLINDKTAAESWLQQTLKPALASNHFLQRQWRNIARAQILLGEYDSAFEILEELNLNARNLELVSDLNRNLLLLNQLYWQKNDKNAAQSTLIEALNLAGRTGFLSYFVIEGESMAQQLRLLLQLNVLSELERHRAQHILREINQHHRHKFAHFDENFVNRLLTHPQVPELIRISPLTQREWQVLGLIYSGYSNVQIANEFNVASTTIKTHIRNLYQKLGVLHRQEAVALARQLLQTMGYNAV